MSNFWLGEDVRKSSKVPRKVGVLKLIIRRYNPNELAEDEATGTPFEVAILPKYEEQECKIKKEEEANAQATVVDEYHDTFDKWYDAKPRQTHTAE